MAKYLHAALILISMVGGQAMAQNVEVNCKKGEPVTWSEGLLTCYGKSQNDSTLTSRNSRAVDSTNESTVFGDPCCTGSVQLSCGIGYDSSGEVYGQWLKVRGTEQCDCASGNCVFTPSQ